jgi:flagellum-specific ATP synthase
MRAWQPLSIYGDMEELIRLGAYRKGSNPETDMSIELFSFLEAFLTQSKEEATNLGEGYGRLAQIVSAAASGTVTGRVGVSPDEIA